MNNFYAWFLVLQFLTSSARRLQVHVHNITVNNNGHIAHGSILPACGSSGMINLLSYKYFNCGFGISCDFSLERNLSAASELIIHEMCSMKQKCTQSRFPISDTYNERIIQLEYHCLNHFDTFLDICDTTSKSTEGTIHLMNRGNVSSQICQCTVKGTFSLELTDVRLKTTYGNQCSDAKLRILNRTYICNGAEDGYGSVYRNNVGETLSEVVVILSTDSRGNAKPEMIYLTIVSTAPVEISCQIRLRDTVSAPWRTTGSSIVVPVTETKDTSTKTSIDTNGLISICAMAVITVGLVLIFIGIKLYHRRILALRSSFQERQEQNVSPTRTNHETETADEQLPESTRPNSNKYMYSVAIEYA